MEVEKALVQWKAELVQAKEVIAYWEEPQLERDNERFITLTFVWSAKKAEGDWTGVFWSVYQGKW